MDKTTLQEKMNWGMKKNIEAFGNTITFEYNKIGATSKLRQTFTGNSCNIKDAGLQDMTAYNKDSLLFKIPSIDLVEKLNTSKLKNLNGVIYFNNIKYNIINEIISPDGVMTEFYCNTV